MIDWQEEWPQIAAVATDFGVDPLFVAAIRVCEHGGEGRQYGVLSQTAPTYEAQLRACCASVRNRLSEYGANPLDMMACQTEQGEIRRVCYAWAFIETFAHRWAPVGAENDPGGLNKNWFENVRATYAKFVARGGVE